LQAHTSHVQSKKDFQAALAPLNNCFASPLALQIQHVTVGSPSSLDGTQTAVVELRASSKGKTTGMPFKNFYAWVCVFDKSKAQPIVRVRAYLDSALVKDLMAKEQNDE
jgi:ketosteroid isomerase-like protein